MNLTFLDKEHSLNKVLKSQKASNSNIKILFISLWDSYSTALVEKLKEKNSSAGSPLYVVDSFEMPHSFIIFNTFKVPHLVSLRGNKVKSEEYLPRIYKQLDIK